MLWCVNPDEDNHQLESRVRENRSHGSEGGEACAFPTPIVLFFSTKVQEVPAFAGMTFVFSSAFTQVSIRLFWYTRVRK